MKVPNIKAGRLARSKDDYARLKQAELSERALRASDLIASDAGAIVFDYYKTRADLQQRFVLHMDVRDRRMIIEDLHARHEVGVIVVNDTNTEIGIVLREALIAYHLGKAEARFKNAAP